MADATHYEYRSADGRLLYIVARYGDGWASKTFEVLSSRRRRLDKFPDETVLYRLPELMAANRKQTVFIVEGEKDCDRLRGLDVVATTNPGGCHLGWKDAYSHCLRGRQVVILPDHDRAGARHAESVERSLRVVSRDVRVLKLPRLGRSEDVSDWLDHRQGTREELLRLAGRTSRPAPPPRGRQAKSDAVFRAERLSSTDRLVLLAIQHYSGSAARITAGDLAQATALHRVTVQRTVTALTTTGILSRDGGRLTIHYERL